MNNLRAVEAKLPPGFRFHPRDEELICDYLMKKVTSAFDLYPLMIQVDLNKCEPWDIPETALVGGKECYFFSQRDRKYATGLRTNRATASGYWKATGKDRPVLRNGTLVGMRKTLVFYQGRAPKGRKTDWVMHEFRLEGPFTPANLSTAKEDWVLCRVLLKNKDEVTKQDTGSSSGCGGGGDTSPSSTSPAPYITSSDQTHPNNNYDQLQVSSSFSIFTPNDQIHQNSIPTFSYLSHMENNNFLPNSFGGLGTDFGSSSSSYMKNNNSSSDNNDQKKGIKYVLNQLTTTESNYPSHHVKKGAGSSSFGEGSSDFFFIRGAF